MPFSIILFFLLPILFFHKSELILPPQEYITCISDFILLNKQLKTIYFAEKIEQEWEVKRVIQKDFVKDFLINKEDMAKFLGYNYATNCFELNKELVFNYNNKLINKIKNLFLFKNEFNLQLLFDKISKNYLDLSDNMQNKLSRFQ